MTGAPTSPPGAARARGLLASVAGTLALAGCESHTVTRAPDPPIGAFGWLVVWLATGAVGAVWVAHALPLLVGRRTLSVDRRLLGGAYVGAGVFAAGWAGFGIAADRRLDSILGHRSCRGLPLEDRPRQIVQLTCTDGFDGSELLIVLYLVPALVLSGCLAIMVLRGDARPWLPTVAAGAGVIGLIALITGSGGTWTGSQAALWVAAFTIAVTAAVCGGRELSRPVPVPAPPARSARSHRLVAHEAGAAVPATIADRFQALVIDALLLAVPLSLLANQVQGAVEAGVILFVILLYSVGTTTLWGATFGKRCLRLKVMSEEANEPPDLGAAVVRFVAFLGPPVVLTVMSRNWLPTLAWAVLVIASGWGGNHRAIHDRAARTRVIRRA